MEFNNDIKYYNVDKEEVTKDLSVNPEKVYQNQKSRLEEKNMV